MTPAVPDPHARRTAAPGSRASLSCGGRRFKAPAVGALPAVRPVAFGTAPGAQPRGAVSVAGSRGSGGQGAPRAVADVRIGRVRADGGRREPARQAHGPGHPAVEPTAADHARLDGRRRGQLNREAAPAPALTHGAALDCRCRASVRPAGSPAGTSRTGHVRRSSWRRTGYRSRRRGGEPAPRRRGPVAPRRTSRTAYGPAAAETARTAYRDEQPAGPRSAFFRRWDRRFASRPTRTGRSVDRGSRRSGAGGTPAQAPAGPPRHGVATRDQSSVQPVSSSASDCSTPALTRAPTARARAARSAMPDGRP